MSLDCKASLCGKGEFELANQDDKCTKRRIGASSIQEQCISISERSIHDQMIGT